MLLYANVHMPQKTETARSEKLFYTELIIL